MRVLVAEDDRGLRSVIQRGLSENGYVVDAVEDGSAAVAYLRSYEYVEMEQRVRAAMQRISELESIVQRDPGLRGGGGTPVRSSLGPSGNSNGSNHGPFASAIAQAGLDRSPMRTDDVRIGVRDKSLRRGMKGSPRSSFGRLDT